MIISIFNSWFQGNIDMSCWGYFRGDNFTREQIFGGQLLWAKTPGDNSWMEIFQGAIILGVMLQRVIFWGSFLEDNFQREFTLHQWKAMEKPSYVMVSILSILHSVQKVFSIHLKQHFSTNCSCYDLTELLSLRSAQIYIR